MRAIPVLLVWFCILICVLGDDRNCEISQNAPQGEPYTRICVPKWAINRTYSASTQRPIASALSKSPSAIKALRQLISFVSDEAMRVNIADDKTPMFEFPSQRPCNIFYNEASLSVNLAISEYGFGVLQEYCRTVDRKFGCSTCITDLNEPDKQSMRKTATAIREYFDALASVANSTIRSMRPALSWSDAFTFMQFPYRSLFDDCTISHFAAFKVEGKWGVNTGLTNASPLQHLPDWHRHYLVEILRVENDKIVPILMNLRKEPPPNFQKSTGFNTSFISDSTTVINSWGGRPGMFLFAAEGGAMDNPALRAATEMSSATVEQIEDATTLSGMAIFIVPVLATLVPLTVFSEVDTKILLVYTIVTDILTVLPLGIKGVEIIGFSTRTIDAMRSRMYGTGLTATEPVVMETWYAKCNARPRAGIFGIIYLLLAAVFMTLGITLELYSKRVFDRRAATRKVLEDEDISLLQSSWKNAICDESWCRCVGMCNRVQPKMQIEDNYC